MLTVIETSGGNFDMTLSTASHFLCTTNRWRYDFRFRLTNNRILIHLNHQHFDYFTYHNLFLINFIKIELLIDCKFRDIFRRNIINSESIPSSIIEPLGKKRR